MARFTSLPLPPLGKKNVPTAISWPSTRFALAISVLLLATSALPAQTLGTGSVTGRVVDATGSVLEGASVSVRHGGTGLERTLVTPTSGLFRFPLLPVGLYTLEVALDGFETIQRNDILVTVGGALGLGDLALAVSTVEESITVTAESPLVETARSVVASTVNERSIQNLPIEGRDFKDFAKLTPTIVDGPRFTISIGGMKGIDTNVTVDGADFNNPFFGSATGQPEVQYYVVSQEAVQEFQVLANGYSAELGRSGGGFLNMVTKSGTNQLSGGAFFLGRAEGLQSSLEDEQGDKLDNADFSQRQYGGNLGGPIVANKAHFFVAFDQQRFHQPVFIRFRRDVREVPSNSELYGLPVSGVDRLADEERDTAQKVRNTAVLAKVDYQISSSSTLTLRYNYSNFRGRNFFFPGGTVNPIQSQTENHTEEAGDSAHAFVLSHTGLWSGNKLNEIRFQYAIETRPRERRSDDVPQVTILDCCTFGSGGWLPISSNHRRLQLSDNFTYLFARHDLKVGADVNLTSTVNAFYGFSGGAYVFPSLESYVAGNPAFFLQRIGLNGFTTEQSGTTDFGQREVALYVEDTWRPGPGWTLSLGLRWEGLDNPSVPERDHGLPARNPEAPGLDSIGLVQHEIPDDWNNFAPRFGLAWDLGNDGRTVFRGGAGIFYSRTPLLLMSDVLALNGYRQAQLAIGPADPNFPEFPFVFPADGIAADDPLLESLGPSSITFFDSDFGNPRTTRANLGVERALTRELSVGADIVVAKTVGSQRRTNRNLSPPYAYDPYGRGLYDVRDRLDPRYGDFVVVESTARRRYTALILSARKRFARGVQFDAYYTLSQNKTDDDNERTAGGYENSQPEDLDADWADSALDVRHRLVANTVVAVPGGFTVGALLVMSTGRPFNVVTGVDDNGDGNFTDRAVVDDSNRATTLAAGLDLPIGLQPRNSARQPARFNLDLRVAKNLDLGRAGRWELLFEVFNAFNNANRFTTNTVFGSPSFARLNAAGTPRQIQVGARYRW